MFAPANPKQIEAEFLYMQGRGITHMPNIYTRKDRVTDTIQQWREKQLKVWEDYISGREVENGILR